MTADLRAGAWVLALLWACSSGDVPVPASAIPLAPAAAGTGQPPRSAASAASVGASASSAGAGGAMAPQGTPQTSAPIGPASPIGPAVPAPEAGPDPHNWVGFGGGVEQTYARPDADIAESNLAELGAASWEGSAPGGVTGTPAIYDGVVYWADWVGNVHAQKITDGTEQWNPPVQYKRGFTSSPFVTHDTVFLSDRDNMVRALDRATGKERWSTAISDNKLAQLWSSPTVADGVVVVGLGGKGTSNGGVRYSAADLMTFRGAVVGLDAETGQVRWRFENTQADGMMYGPGVSAWSSAALDTKAKVAYIGTGNSYYSPASPYSDSLLALNYMTTHPEGELVWHQQFTKDDNFTSGSPMGPDSDVGATPNLFSVGGKDYVAVGDKGGGIYIIDRQRGELAFPRIAGGSGAGSSGSSTAVGVMAPGAYGDGTLYITADFNGATRVLAIDVSSGAIRWSTMDPGGVSYGAPLLLKDVLLIGTTTGSPSGAARGGELHAYRRSDGSLVPWKLPIKNQRGGGISVYRNTLLVPYGYVFENDRAESMLTGGVFVAALGGKVVEPGPSGPAATYAPTFGAVYSELLAEKGCTSDFCHGGTGLRLGTQAEAYTSLLGVATGMGCSGMPLITAGKPEESYLYQKLQPDPKCGKQMPDGLMPLTTEQLTQVRDWIRMGAQNN